MYLVICDQVPVTTTSEVMSASVKPHERSIAKLSPVATAPPSGTVLDSAAEAVFVTAASLIRSPGRAITIGGQFVARLTTPSTTTTSTCHQVMSASALCDSVLVCS